MAKQLTYLMYNHRNRYVKIGKSNNPSFREKTLQSEEPEVSLLAISPLLSERDLHRIFSSKRLRGEWFALSLTDLERLILAGFELTEEGMDFIWKMFGVWGVSHLEDSREKLKAAVDDHFDIEEYQSMFGGIGLG